MMDYQTAYCLYFKNTTLASPKVGGASDEKINSFILFFSRLALPLHQSRNSTLRDTAKWCRTEVEQ